MRLSNKHANAQIVSYSNFSGGLNTTVAAEMIEMNELSRCINLEADKATGCLRTVAGTNPVYVNYKMVFSYLIHDSIGDNILLTDIEGNVYQLIDMEDDSPLMNIKLVGKLSGDSSVEYVAWEDGVIITSGGRLQYFHGGVLEDIADDGAPTSCHSPYVQSGRIFVSIGDELHCSAVGDEHGWKNDPGDDSSSQWLQIGYKDGGIITGVCSLSSDTIIFKSNRRAYHLAGVYPDWTLSEIGRSIDCKGFNCCVSLANSAIAVGKDTVQALSVTDTYGDMKANDISYKVKAQIQSMKDVKARFIPSLNQVWFITGLPSFLFLDANNSGYYHRQYHSHVVDATETKDGIYVLKNHGLYRCDDSHFIDESEPMMWKLQGKTLTSVNSFLVKREWVDTTPYFQNYAENLFKVDKAVLYGAVPKEAMCVYHDFSKLYRSIRPVYNIDYKPIFTDSDEVYANPEYVFSSDIYLKSISMYRAQLRQVTRNKAVKVKAYGTGGRLLVNSINFEIAEV